MSINRLTDWSVRRPFLWVGGVAAVAALVVVWLPAWVSVAVGCILPLFFAFRFGRRSAGILCVVSGLLFLTVGLWFRLQTVEPVERLAGQEDTLVGVVETCPGSGHLYTVRVTEARLLPTGSRVLLYVSDLAAPQPYETVFCRVRLQKLYPSQYIRRADGIYLLAYPIAYGEDSVQTAEESRRPWDYPFTALRRRLAVSLREALPGHDGALLAGICLGEVGGLSAETYEAFRRSGLTHLLVVSGLHLSLVATGLLGFFRLCRVRRRPAAVLTMGGVVAFSLLVGLSPSATRAAVACLVMLAGQVFRRRSDGLNSMGLALTLLLGYNPYACLDIGLQLSFAAVVGILAVAPAIKGALTATLPATGHRLRRWLAETLAVTGGATLTVTPFLCIHFGQFSRYSLVSNLLAAVPAGWALLLGLVGLLIPAAGPLLLLRRGVLLAAGGVCRWLSAVAHLFGGEGTVQSTGRLWQTVLTVGVCLLLAVGFVWGTARQRRRLFAGLCALVLLTTGMVHLLSRHSLMLHVFPAGEEAAILLEYQGEYGLLITHSQAQYAAEQALADSGCGTPAFVVTGRADTTRRMSVQRVYGLDDLPMEPLSLWDGVSLCRLSDGAWQLTAGSSALLLLRKGAIPPPTGGGCVVYLGVPSVLPLWAAQTVIIGEKENLGASTDELPRRLTVLKDAPRYISTRGRGEWSILPWR